MSASSQPRDPLRMSWKSVHKGLHSSNTVLRFTNCRIIKRGKLLFEDIWILNGRIIDPAKRFWQAADAKELVCKIVIDCAGHILSPGFIDLQFNGAFGVDFSNPNLTCEDIIRVCTKLPKTGVTSFCPTIVSSAASTYMAVIQTFNAMYELLEAQQKMVEQETFSPERSLPAMSRLLGLHLEGPFINKQKRGAHAEEHLRTPALTENYKPHRTEGAESSLAREREKPFIEGSFQRDLMLNLSSPGQLSGHESSVPVTPSAVERNQITQSSTNNENGDSAVSYEEVNAALSVIYGYSDWPNGLVRIITLAPELKGGIVATKILSDSGVVVSLGHSKTDIRKADECVQQGATMITHLFNAMNSFHHRDPGLVGLLGRVHDQAKDGEEKQTSLWDDKRKDLYMSAGVLSSAAPALGGVKLSRFPDPPSIVSPYTSVPSRLAIAAAEIRHQMTTNFAHLPPARSKSHYSSSAFIRGPGCPLISSPMANPLPFVPDLEETVLVKPALVNNKDNKPGYRPYFGLITDGVHVHPNAVRIAYEAHPKGLVLVTDAMQALGLGVGRHLLGDMDVEIFHGKQDGHYDGLHAVLANTDTLAGAVLPLHKCLTNFRDFVACSIEEALKTVTVNPAEVLGLSQILGSLTVGSWADMVLLDVSNKEMKVLQTWIGGMVAYQNEHIS